MSPRTRALLFFFFNDTATTEIYTLSLHDALPISPCGSAVRLAVQPTVVSAYRVARSVSPPGDRKSTRLNSSHQIISYAVFCLKKKNAEHQPYSPVHVNRYPVLPVATRPSPRSHLT